MDDAGILRDFDDKLRAACDRARELRLTNTFLQQEVGVSHDTWAKWKRGATKPDPQHLRAAIEVFRNELGLADETWALPVGEFRRSIGATGIGTESLPPSALEFRSRDRQPDLLLEQLSGFWTAYYCSTSVTDRIVVSRDLIEVAPSHRNGYISCQVTDGHFSYSGFCFTYAGGLVQWLLEKDVLYNEVLSYMTTRPERTPPVLLGLMICTSGGVDTVAQLPAAAKVSMIRLGDASAVADQLGIAPSKVRDVLRRHIPRYLSTSDVPRWVRSAVSNVIASTDAPSALTVPAAAGPSMDQRVDTIRSLISEVRDQMKAE